MADRKPDLGVLGEFPIEGTDTGANAAASPDLGVLGEFPIEAAKPPAGEAPVTTARGVARNAAAGVLDAAGNVINFASDPSGNLGKMAATAGVFLHDALAPAFGYERFPDDVRRRLLDDTAPQPGNRLISGIGNALGVDPDAVPAATQAERMTRLGVGGAGAAAATGPAGIVAPLAGAAGAVAGDVAGQNVPEWQRPMVEMAGNAAGAYVGAKAGNAATRAVNAVAGAETPVTAAYKRLGIDRDLLGDVSGGPTARAVQAYASQSPFGSGVVAPKEAKAVAQFGGAVERTAAKLGTATSEQAAGEALQTDARNWRDTVFPQREDAAWQPVNQMMQGEVVDLGNYRTALTTLTGKLAALPETQKALLPPRIQQMLDAINADVPPGGTIPWQQAQQLRSAIGRVMGVPEIVQSVGKDQLKAAYGGISQDLKGATQAVDARNQTAGIVLPSTEQAFAAANRVSTEGHAFIDNVLSRLIRANNPAQESITPERAARAALGSGDTIIDQIRREMPGAANELAAYKLRDMAMATPGAAGRTGTETSVGTFLTDLNKLRQQGGAGALFADPRIAADIDALATVADTMKETARRANTSKTGPYLALAEAAPAAFAGYQAAGLPGALGAAVLPFFANRFAAHGVTFGPMTRAMSAPGPRNPVNPLVPAVAANIEDERMRNRLMGGAP